MIDGYLNKSMEITGMAKLNLPPYVSRKGKKCPACGRYTYRNWSQTEIVMVCSTCGHCNIDNLWEHKSDE